MASKKNNTTVEKYDSDSDGDNSRSRSRIGNKFTRRARSFKDDLFDKIASIRSPRSMSGSRSISPRQDRSRVRRGKSKSHSPNRRDSTEDCCDFEMGNPVQNLEDQLKKMHYDLSYFHGVIAKHTLGQLPGTATFVLDTVTNIHTILKSSCFLDEHNSSVVSGLNQLYQTLSELMKQCDDLMFLSQNTENEHLVEMTKELVIETVNLLEDAVQNLVLIANGKTKRRETRSMQNGSGTSSRNSTEYSEPSHSWPSSWDIAMTSQERQLMEQTTRPVLDRHLSRTQQPQTEDEQMPPPKPPLPDSWMLNESPPPLPPKMRNLNLPVAVYTTLTVGSSVSTDKISVKSENSSASSFSDFSIDEFTSKRLSSSSSGFASMRNSSSQNNVVKVYQKLHRMYTTTSFPMMNAVKMTERSQMQLESVSASLSEVQLNQLPDDGSNEEIPPALPAKTRKMQLRREHCVANLPHCISPLDEPGNSGIDLEENGCPPPLPLKKKHIMAYMEMFGNCAHSKTSTTDFLQYPADSYNMLQTEWQRHDMVLNNVQYCSLHFSSRNSTASDSSSPPPALPPRRNQLNNVISSQSSTFSLSPTSPEISTVFTSPLSPGISKCDESTNLETVKSVQEEVTVNGEDGAKDQDCVSGNGNDVSVAVDDDAGIPDLLAELDVWSWLKFRDTESDGEPKVRGGRADALVVWATKADKDDLLYQEAFLTTYRTFITPKLLIEKLIDRYYRFDSLADPVRHRTARESFSLLVRVIDDLMFVDLDEQVIELLTSFNYQLLRNGDLLQAKTLRKKWMDKYDRKLRLHKRKANDEVEAVTPEKIFLKQSTLFDFKSEHLAEQLTLLDAELFNRIEIPEVLLYSKAQQEEVSPNLTVFTEQFNKMSYWARTRILEQSDHRERERYMMKFLKIMKHLRRINNYNSYLGLLAAVDCAAVRRLGWQRHIMNGLDEHCALIDSSGSFRAYRLALANTQPPCIPYIGLVLQDLTFVQSGNDTYLDTNRKVLNFARCWLQFRIIENVRRFHDAVYGFRTREEIVAYFNNFDDYLCEEKLWSISESIKTPPRKKRDL